MSESNDSVRITVTVDQATASKINELAERMSASPSKMASWLLEAGLEDNDRIIRIVTSKVVSGLKAALTGIKKRAG